MATMQIHLLDSAGNKFTFPVNPEEIAITRNKAFETVNIMALGEYDFPTGEKVKEIAFSSFFSAEYDEGYCNFTEMKDPQEAMNYLTKLMNSKTPVRLVIDGTAVNVLVTISAHNSTFKGGETGDVYFDLTARTWRDMKVHTTKAAAGKSHKASRPDTKKPGKTYVVKSGDTLSKIAKLELGDSSKWQLLYKTNQKTIGKNPNKLQPGQKLVMPE